MRLWTLLGVFALMAHGVLSDDGTNTTSVDPSTSLTTQPPTNETTSEQPTTNATTEHPTNTTTVEPPTTERPTVAPTPPPDSIWVVNGTKGACIMLKMEADFFYSDGTNTSLPTWAVIGDESTCEGNGTQVIKLLFDSNAFSLTFSDTNCGAKKFCTSSVVFEHSGNSYSNSSDLPPLFAAKTGNSYFCQAANSFSLFNETHMVNVTVKNVQVEAFHDETKKADFGTKEECAADDHTNDIVPIAVGCALAGLVIIVLIAYLVGRRRNRQKGYQSV